MFFGIESKYVNIYRLYKPSYDVWNYANSGTYSRFNAALNLQISRDWYNNRGASGALESDYIFEGIFVPAEAVGAAIGRIAARFFGAAKVGVQFSDDLIMAAQELYPNKAGVTELHHIAPMYLGGAKNGALVPLDAAYHQLITNEFRALYPYGLPKPGEMKMLEIMKQVYSKYPLPPGY